MKLQNILMTSDGIMKLSDFGLTKEYELQDWSMNLIKGSSFANRCRHSEFFSKNQSAWNYEALDSIIE